MNEWRFKKTPGTQILADHILVEWRDGDMFGTSMAKHLDWDSSTLTWRLTDREPVRADKTALIADKCAKAKEQVANDCFAEAEAFIDIAKEAAIRRAYPETFVTDFGDVSLTRNFCDEVNDRHSQDDVDMVNSPPHYTSHPSGVECIDVVEHMSFNIGTAVRYLWRADLKWDTDEDLKKARWYIEREISKRLIDSED